MQEEHLNEKLLATCRKRYAGFSDEALAVVASSDLDDLTTEARMALEAELVMRDREAIESRANTIREKRSAEAAKSVQAPFPERRWEDRQRASSAYAQTTKIARWLGFLPAAWQAGNVHSWILRPFGMERMSNIDSISDENLLAFGLAGFLTPIVVIALGAWICPARKKTMPVLALCLLCIVGSVYTLHMLTGSAWNAEMRHLFGLDAIVTIAVSVMIGATCWLAPWNKRVNANQVANASVLEGTAGP